MKFRVSHQRALKIVIDGYEANVPQRLGSGQVAFELLKNLENLDKKNSYTIVLPDSPLEDLPKSRPGWEYQILKPKKLWTRIALPLYLYRVNPKPDLIFSPTHYIPRFSPIKRIVTVFDLSYLHYPEFFLKKDLWQLTNWTKYSVKNAAHIITISNDAKSDIIKSYQIDKQKITVAHPGFETVYKPISDTEKIQEIQQKYQTSDNYIIYIGTIQPRKNLIRLIEAFAKIEGAKLVIVGKTTGLGRSGWMYESILKRPKELGIEEKIIFTGFVPTDDLIYLLNGAKAFILPSLYEGFGIPVVNAMATGTPVIVSNVSSLPEIVGESGLLVNPKSVDQIEQAIRLVLSDKKLRTKLSKLALVRSHKFSWKKMATEVLKVFERVIQE